MKRRSGELSSICVGGLNDAALIMMPLRKILSPSFVSMVIRWVILLLQFQFKVLNKVKAENLEHSKRGTMLIYMISSFLTNDLEQIFIRQRKALIWMHHQKGMARKNDTIETDWDHSLALKTEVWLYLKVIHLKALCCIMNISFKLFSSNESI